MRQFIKDNWEEAVIGFVLGAGFFWAIGYYSLLLGLWTGVLWRLGGMGYLGTKAWRGWGVPIMITVSMWQRFTPWTLLPIALTVLLLSIGYGQRDVNDQVGSPLGNFWLSVAGEHAGKWLARATIIIGVWSVWAICLSF